MSFFGERDSLVTRFLWCRVVDVLVVVVGGFTMSDQMYLHSYRVSFLSISIAFAHLSGVSRASIHRKRRLDGSPLHWGASQQEPR